MTLLEYYKSLSIDARQDVALSCNTSVGHLRNVAYGFRTCSPGLAIALEQVSNGAVTRKVCPTWRRIWPDFEKEMAC